MCVQELDYANLTLVNVGARAIDRAGSARAKLVARASIVQLTHGNTYKRVRPLSVMQPTPSVNVSSK